MRDNKNFASFCRIRIDRYLSMPAYEKFDELYFFEFFHTISYAAKILKFITSLTPMRKINIVNRQSCDKKAKKIGFSSMCETWGRIRTRTGIISFQSGSRSGSGSGSASAWKFGSGSASYNSGYRTRRYGYLYLSEVKIFSQLPLRIHTGRTYIVIRRQLVCVST